MKEELNKLKQKVFWKITILVHENENERISRSEIIVSKYKFYLKLGNFLYLRNIKDPKDVEKVFFIQGYNKAPLDTIKRSLDTTFHQAKKRSIRYLKKSIERNKDARKKFWDDAAYWDMYVRYKENKLLPRLQDLKYKQATA